MPWPLVAAGAAAGASYLGQRSANKQNLKIAREQMAFQERMSGTAYQRAMDDMRKSGLNPMLAYQQGGASTPGGASAKMESTLGPAVSSAMGVKRLTAELRGINAAVGKTEAETMNLMKQNTILDLEAERSKALSPLINLGGRGLNAATEYLEENIGSAGEIARRGMRAYTKPFRAVGSTALEVFNNMIRTGTRARQNVGDYVGRIGRQIRQRRR